MPDDLAMIRCEARGWRFDVVVDASAHAAVRPLFVALERPGDGGAARATFTLRREAAAATRWSVLADGRLMMGCEQVSEAVHALMVFVNQSIVAASSHLCIHAAGVAIGASGILLPGASGSGKTTVCARLLQRGATYLSDDSVALDGKGLMVGYPKPLGFKWGTWQGFDDLDLTDLEVEPGRQVVWQVPPARLGAVSTASAAPVMVVAPRFRAGEPLRVERLPCHRAAWELLSQSQNLLSFGIERALGLVGRVVARCDSYAVTYGDASQVAEEVLDFLATAPASAGEPAGCGAAYEVMAAAAPPRGATQPFRGTGVSALCFEDGAVLIRDGTGEGTAVDGIGARIWSRLDGSRSLAGIACELSEAFDASRDEVGADITGWVGQLVSRGLVQLPLAGPGSYGEPTATKA